MQLYVGNLDYGTTDQSLKDLFAEYGEVVSAKIIMDRETGRSKGFGFVEMAVKNEGIKAISNLNGQELNGRNIKVNEAQQKPAGGGGNRGGGRW
ncbi:MAG: RNA-binding protein [Leptospiraceae bacterium]|nr:RNA-binding protein [Leptospiraceae bacterium]